MKMNSIAVFFIICIIFSPAQLFNIHFFSFKFVPIISLDFLLQFISDLIFCSSLLLLHFTFLLPLLIFVLKFIFSLTMTCFYSTLLLFLTTQTLKTIFLLISHPTFFFLVLKGFYSLSTFIHLSLLVVDMVVVAFLQFCFQIFTIFVFQISNSTVPLSYSILPLACPLSFVF